MIINASNSLPPLQVPLSSQIVICREWAAFRTLTEMAEGVRSLRERDRDKGEADSCLTRGA